MSPSSFNHAILNHVMRLWICVGITFLDSHFEQPLRLNKRLVVVSLSKIVQQILGKRAFNEVKDLFYSRLDSYFSKPTNRRTEPPNLARSRGTSPRPSVHPSISSPSSVLVSASDLARPQRDAHPIVHARPLGSSVQHSCSPRSHGESERFAG